MSDTRRGHAAGDTHTVRWQWYESPQGNHQNPSLSGADALMDPWTYTETDTRSPSALGYQYV